MPSHNNHGRRRSLELRENAREKCRRIFGRTVMHSASEVQVENSLSDIPPFECFASRISETSIRDQWIADLKLGDELFVKVKKVDAGGAYVRPICFAKRLRRDLEFVHDQLIAPVSSLGVRLKTGTFVIVVITQINPIRIEFKDPVTMLSEKELPAYFRNAHTLPSKPRFWDYIKSEKFLENPYTDQIHNVPSCSRLSFLLSKDADTDLTVTSISIRAKQNKDLATQYVTRGVSELRADNVSAALTHFGEAINIDSQCLDAYVARGAAYSNCGQYEKAEADFEVALQINRESLNAVCYMVETLIKRAKELEADGKEEEARQKYRKVLQLREDKRALDALAALNRKRRRSPSVEEIAAPVKQKSHSSKHSSSKKDNNERRKSREEIQKREEDRKKLAEMEAFIQALKKK